MLGFDALSAYAPGDPPNTGTSVPVRDAASVDFVFDGTPYSNPASVDFSWAPAVSSYSGDGAAALDFVPAATGAHGVAGTGAVTLDFSEAGDASFTSVAVFGDGAATLDIAADASAAHGVSGSGAVTLALTSDDVAEHGIAGSADATLSFTAVAEASHGIAGDGAATITFTPAAAAVHERYEVKGEVRLSGVLVNRRVRAHRRDTGEMVGEADTVAGRFAFNVGFAAREHYVIPIDLSDAATDWSPPIANRIQSTLAQDV